MSKQLSIFSLLKKKNNAPLQEDTNKVVKSCLDDIIGKIVLREQNETKRKKTDYIMTPDKLELWPKDERFFFWDTPGGKPTNDSTKKIPWIKIDAKLETFSCWVCQEFRSLCNKENKVTTGCSLWHRNYLTRHDDNKHKASSFSWLFCSENI